MNDPPTTCPEAGSDYQRKLREMNEALLVSSVRQHELTEQAHKAEQALGKALQFADDIIATLREPFLVLDGDLRVKKANRSFYDAFCVSTEETENRLVYDLGNGQWDIPALRQLLNEVLSRNQSVHDYEVEHSFPTLGRKTMLLNARPFPPDSKHPELILLAVEDITAVRAQANELAKANRRKDEFLAMLGHELRGPLAPILNAVHLLRLPKDEHRVQQQASVIERQVTQLTRLVDDLIEVSRITTGRIQLRYERVVLGEIIERAIETARPLIDYRKHELTVALPPHPVWLHADGSRLEQVLVNLLNNAAKYSPEGGHIWLTLQQEGDQCVLRVRDKGVGISSDFLPSIFELFTQAERSLDRSQGGLGIGLALVHRLVEMHKGTVEVVSELGRGSEFVVRLPTLPPPTPEVQSPVRTTVEPIGGLRVLVVDDHVDTAQTLASLLEASGHDVRVSHDGLAALQAAIDYRPDIVLLDIGLPGLSGYEVAKRIRQHPPLIDVELVAMTGYGQDTDRRQAQEAGFNRHLVKPADFAKVQQILVIVAAKKHDALEHKR